MASRVLFYAVFALGLIMLVDGYVAAATVGNQTTLCQTGLVNAQGQCITSSTTVVSTTVQGTVTSTTVTYNPNNVPITITVAPNSAQPPGQAFTFTANPLVQPTGLIVWSWNFGDGSGSTAGATVSHAYPSQGTYIVTVSLSASNEFGNAQTTATVSCVSLLGGALGCQLPTLTVNVMSGYTGSPLGGATVTVTPSGGSAQTGTTNLAGQAIFTVSQNTAYTVSVSASSYNGASQTVQVGTTGTSVTLTLTYNCGRSLCPQSLFGSLTGGALSPALEMIIGAILAIAGGFGAIRRKH